MQTESTNPTPRSRKQPEPRHIIATLEQYEAERTALLERCPRLNPATFIYAPSKCEFEPEVRKHIQAQIDTALGDRIQAFAVRVAELICEDTVNEAANREA